MFHWSTQGVNRLQRRKMIAAPGAGTHAKLEEKGCARKPHSRPSFLPSFLVHHHVLGDGEQVVSPRNRIINHFVLQWSRKGIPISIQCWERWVKTHNQVEGPLLFVCMVWRGSGAERKKIPVRVWLTWVQNERKQPYPWRSAGDRGVKWLLSVPLGWKPFYDVLLATDRKCCDCT